jgi:hypothetical protein
MYNHEFFSASLVNRLTFIISLYAYACVTTKSLFLFTSAIFFYYRGNIIDTELNLVSLDYANSAAAVGIFEKLHRCVPGGTF